MAKITLILGGARSGKSVYALSLAKTCKKVAFIATCEAKDKEMQERIRVHRKVRPETWKTFEEPRDLVPILNKMGSGFECIVVDCLTLLVSNLILGGYKEQEILRKARAILDNLKKKKARVILVSNEVGLGLVPANRLGRDFRDTAGKVNQLLAREADEAFFIVCGIPLRLK
ncbi:MAG: bifunctional adenosylcobinamide kinase/adenosylcobinamide-phosphate guanylyltransferase [Candidatus Omnitrophota bacterium]